jgi:hypothetical protein
MAICNLGNVYPVKLVAAQQRQDNKSSENNTRIKHSVTVKPALDRVYMVGRGLSF